VEGRFLPPEPPGPEPELGGRPAPPLQQQGGGQAGAPPGHGPGQPPPAPGQWQQQQIPPPWQQQPAPPAGSWHPPAGQGWQPPPPPWGYPQPAAPENNHAVAGFVLSLVSLALLVVSVGISSVISVGCAVAGMVLGRKGVRRVDAGETPRHRGLAQAGFWIGVAALVLSLLATAAWIAVLVAAVSDDEFRDDLEREFDDSESITAVVTVLRLALLLVA
jgi:hypothetical protein